MDYQRNNLQDFLQMHGRVVLQRVDNNNNNMRYFTENEIQHITEGYSTLLGKGAFGEVYKGKLDDQLPVAVKRYIYGAQKEEFAKEVIVHSQINHRNVVRLLGCCTEENALMIVMEFIPGGNLDLILHNSANGRVPFPLDKRLEIAIQVSEVLWCMHSMYNPVLHGDIKPANILLDGNLTPKVSDFGIARLLCANGSQHTRNIIGSIGYIDPAYCETGILTPKSDVYSFGVVLLEIITRKKAVDGTVILAQSFNGTLEKGKNVMHMFDQEINNKKNMKFLKEVGELAAKCLRREVNMRPGMIEVATSLRMIRNSLQGEQGNPSQRDTGVPNYSISSKELGSGAHQFGNLNQVHAASTNSESGPCTAPNPVNSATKTLPTVLPTISLDELNQMRNFSNNVLITKGLLNKVFFGVLKNGQKCVVKELDNHYDDILAQVGKMSRMYKHDNVVQLLGYFIDERTHILAYEYAPKGSLQDILHGINGGKGSQTPLSWMQRVKIAVSAAKGLEFLHEKVEPPIIHTNIKSSNILLFDDDIAKLSDVGLPDQLTMLSIKDNYYGYDRIYTQYDSGYVAPPEYALTGTHSKKSDTYNFGVVLLELLTGRKAFDRTLPHGQRQLVTWALPRLSEDMVKHCVDPRLGGHYPPKSVAKFAAVAALCLQCKDVCRPEMSTVVKALSELLDVHHCLHQEEPSRRQRDGWLRRFFRTE